MLVYPTPWLVASMHLVVYNIIVVVMIMMMMMMMMVVSFVLYVLLLVLLSFLCYCGRHNRNMPDASTMLWSNIAVFANMRTLKMLGNCSHLAR